MNPLKKESLYISETRNENSKNERRKLSDQEKAKFREDLLAFGDLKISLKNVQENIKKIEKEKK